MIEYQQVMSGDAKPLTLVPNGITSPITSQITCHHLTITLQNHLPSPGHHLGITWASPGHHLGITWLRESEKEKTTTKT